MQCKKCMYHIDMGGGGGGGGGGGAQKLSHSYQVCFKGVLFEPPARLYPTKNLWSGRDA